MTKEQITLMVASSIASLLTAVILKLLDIYMPEKKKLTSYIKNAFRFAFLYILPIACIMYLMLFSSFKVDRLFVFFMSMFVCIVFVNMLLPLILLHGKAMKLISQVNSVTTAGLQGLVEAGNQQFEVFQEVKKKMDEMKAEIDQLRNQIS